MSGVLTFLDINLIFPQSDATKTERLGKMGDGDGSKRVTERVADFSDSTAVTWPSFAYVASLQGKGPRKHKQQRSCSWSRAAVACLPRPP